MKSPLRSGSFFQRSFILFLLLASAPFLRAENTRRVNPSTPEESLLEAFDICGVVMDMTPDISEENFAELARAGATEEGDRALDKILKPRVASGAVVAVQGDSVRQEVVADALGKFRFVGFTDGEYEISAVATARLSRAGEKRMATGKKRVKYVSGGATVPWLEIHAYPVTIRGRITDAAGRPIADAKVVGTPVPFRKHDIPNTVSTVSKLDGSYELTGFIPPDLYRVANYLAGGDPLEGGEVSDPFYVEIKVDAVGFVQDENMRPRVPLVTEEWLVPARRLLRCLITNSKYRSEEEKQSFREREDLPSSRGNAITGIDIVMVPVAGAAGGATPVAPAGDVDKPAAQ